MSVSFTAKLFLGVPLKSVWEVKTEETTITKYNPNTGEPYQITKEVAYFCGKPTDWDTHPFEQLESETRLQIGYDHYEGKKDQWILGKQLYFAMPSYAPSIVPINQQYIEEVYAEVLEKLQAHGFDSPEEIGMYLIAHVS